MIKKMGRYKVDLSRHMAECEANYWRMMKLMPNLSSDDSREIGICLNGQDVCNIQFKVIERNKYTTTVSVNAVTAHDDCLRRWILPKQIVVRIYHDAEVAEVIACEGERGFWPRYEYPNLQMRQPDEKIQINFFLGEWLNHCLQHGLTLEDTVLV
jgi:uncharacterized protein YqiB (DUF1249 family)